MPKLQEQSIFIQAMEREPAERSAFLDIACASDPALRQRVERLLHHHERADSFLAEPAVGLPARRQTIETSAASECRPHLERLGSSIGAYRLLEQIGEGGMGAVFLAEQQRPVRRKVALKVIKAGMDTRRVVARFKAERQALALMDHPNIAKVFDAGVTDTGRPYFVMELVKGVPITKYCDEHRLAPKDRLGLFVQVCQAVQHAHQKGIIHRDLKPNNVLVASYDGRPVPKVIDFGVAKATGGSLTEHTVFTGFGAVVGTPEYMSPEQAEFNQLDVDTRSDVYSLGVLLYELLTGSTPLDRTRFKQTTLMEVLRVVREEEPPRPSTRLSATDQLVSIAASRGLEPRKLGALVRGDLDWIVMKALEKDRSRRYETANGLAMDVRRYLVDEPVHACPPTAAYRLRKFLGRNRGPLLAAVLVLLALAGGIVGTIIGLVQARQARHMAEKRLAQIEKGIDLLGSIFEDLDPRAEEKEGRPLREILVDRLDRAAAELEGEAVGDPLVVARMQDQLGRTYLGMDCAAKAQALFTKALATRSAHLGADHADTLDSMLSQALAYQAAEELPRAVALFERVHDAQVKKLGTDHPHALTTGNYLGVAYRRANRPAKAVALLKQVGALRAERLGADNPDTLTTLNSLALAHRAAGKATESITLYQRVRDARTRRLGPEDPDTLTTLHHLAMAYRCAGKLDEAIAVFEQLREAQTKRLGPDHPHTLTVLNNLAWTYGHAGKLDEAIDLYEQVREARTRKFEADYQDAFITLVDMGEAYNRAGKLEQALRLYDQAALGIEKRKFVHPDAARIVYNLFECHEALKQYEEAEVWRRKWLAAVKDRAGTESIACAEELLALGVNLLLQGKNTDAEPFLRECLVIRRKKTPDEWATFHAELLIGAALFGQGRYAEAEQFLLQGYEGLKKCEEKVSPELARSYLREAEARLVQLYDRWDRPREAAKWQEEMKAVAKR